MQQEELWNDIRVELQEPEFEWLKNGVKSKGNYTSSYEHLSISNNKQIFTVNLWKIIFFQTGRLWLVCNKPL